MEISERLGIDLLMKIGHRPVCDAPIQATVDSDVACVRTWSILQWWRDDHRLAWLLRVTQKLGSSPLAVAPSAPESFLASWLKPDVEAVATPLVATTEGASTSVFLACPADQSHWRHLRGKYAAQKGWHYSNPARDVKVGGDFSRGLRPKLPLCASRVYK